MGLTNAERQARWRERQKQKLAEAQALVGAAVISDGCTVSQEDHDAAMRRCADLAYEKGVMAALTQLHEAWKSGLVDWVEFKGKQLSEDEGAAIDAVLAEYMGIVEMAKVLRMTAFSRATRHWESVLYSRDPPSKPWDDHLSDLEKRRPKSTKLRNKRKS